jgi:hypothetical protein
MNYHLFPGLHIAIATNISGGYGGSMFALESYAICRKYGIPAILASFDLRRAYPIIGGDIRRLRIPGVKRLPQDAPYHFEDLSQVFDEARANHKFVIIDVPAGFCANHPMFGVLMNSGIQNSTSIAALVPIMAEDYGTCGAEMAMRTFTNSGIRFNRGLFRRWALHASSSPANITRLPNYPVWRAGCLSRRAIDLVMQEAQRVGNPAFNHLPRLIELHANRTLQSSDQGPLEEAITHLEGARKAIFKTLLAPISRSVS